MIGISLTDPIPPLQGLKNLCMHFALDVVQCSNYLALTARQNHRIAFKKCQGNSYHYNVALSISALKGQLDFKTGQRPVTHPTYCFTSPERA